MRKGSTAITTWNSQRRESTNSIVWEKDSRGRGLRPSTQATSGARRRGRRLSLDTSTLLRRSEEHTSELQSQSNLVCRLLLGKTEPYRLPVTASATRAATHMCTAEYSGV